MDSHDSFIAQDSAGARGDEHSLLNFTTGPDDIDLQGLKRQKAARDPMSHRIIEKRRRDRMNNCLADLSRLIPTSYLKQGQGRIEKTEIIEMAIKHIKTLQTQVDGSQANFNMTGMKQDTGTSGDSSDHSCGQELFYQGFKECQDETLRYFVEGEAMVASDPFCVRVMDHLTSMSQRYDLSRARGEDKKDSHMEMDTQPVSGAGTFTSSSSTTSLPSLDPILPLLSTPGGMMVPVSPVRNKQLRNLLNARALQQLEADREASSSVDQMIRSSSSGEVTSLASSLLMTSASLSINTTVPVYSASSSTNDLHNLSGLGHGEHSISGGCPSSGYVSDTSAVDKFSAGSSAGLNELMLSGKDSNAMNAYKFKHNITKRFSQEGKVISQYDGSSSASSRDAEDEHHHHQSLKHRSLKSKNRYASSSDSGPYPMSDLSGTASAGSPDSGDGAPDRNKNRKTVSKTEPTNITADNCPRSGIPLPGFLLHPSGTHYMPMSVCYSDIPNIFENNGDTGMGPPVFHPISIPVHFMGPVITVPGGSTESSDMKGIDTAPRPKDSHVGRKSQE